MKHTYQEIHEFTKLWLNLTIYACPEAPPTKVYEGRGTNHLTFPARPSIPSPAVKVWNTEYDESIYNRTAKHKQPMLWILYRQTLSTVRKISKYKSQMITVNKPRDKVNGIFPSPVYTKKRREKKISSSANVQKVKDNWASIY